MTERKINLSMPPVPTPKQLENSRKAIEDVIKVTGGSIKGDIRLIKIKEKLPRAKSEYDAWLKRQERLKAFRKRVS